MSFFFLEYYQDIDWSRGYQSLDKEMIAISEEGGFGKQSADKLFRVFLKSGEEQLVLLHIEIQGYKEDVFTWRVYNYNDLMRRKYGQKVLSFAILSDPTNDFRPTGYEWRYRQHHRLYEFPIVKLLDYWDDIKNLERDTNPFALIVLAHLKTQKLKRRPIELKEAKIQAMRLLFERGYKREYVLKLFRAIDWLVKLPKPLQVEFNDEISPSKQEAVRMPLPMTGFEKDAIRRGQKQGLEKGLQQGMAILVEKQLIVKFGEIAPEIAKEIGALNVEQLQELGIAQFYFSSKTDLMNWLVINQPKRKPEAK